MFAKAISGLFTVSELAQHEPSFHHHAVIVIRIDCGDEEKVNGMKRRVETLVPKVFGPKSPPIRCYFKHSEALSVLGIP